MPSRAPVQGCGHHTYHVSRNQHDMADFFLRCALLRASDLPDLSAVATDPSTTGCMERGQTWRRRRRCATGGRTCSCSAVAPAWLARGARLAAHAVLLSGARTAVRARVGCAPRRAPRGGVLAEAAALAVVRVVGARVDVAPSLAPVRLRLRAAEIAAVADQVRAVRLIARIVVAPWLAMVAGPEVHADGAGVAPFLIASPLIAPCIAYPHRSRWVRGWQRRRRG